jgi:hypothetical protein
MEYSAGLSLQLSQVPARYLVISIIFDLLAFECGAVSKCDRTIAGL